MKLRKRDDFQYPDVITASDDYQRRFSGEIGQFLLSVQRELIFEMLALQPDGPKRILELGGAHGQLTIPLLESGHTVVVQCSKEEGFARLRSIQPQYGDRLELVVSAPETLPFDADEFDAVVMVRLLSHLENWTAVLKECARVSRGEIVFDYPTMCSFNFLSPFLFSIKKRIEGNTRRYTCFSDRRIKKELAACGLRIHARKRQFFLPMALHRLWNNPRRSIHLEAVSKKLGITAYFGSPSILAAMQQETPVLLRELPAE